MGVTVKGHTTHFKDVSCIVLDDVTRLHSVQRSLHTVGTGSRTNTFTGFRFHSVTYRSTLLLTSAADVWECLILH